MSDRDYELKTARLYAAIQSVADDFAAKRTGASARESARVFSTLFAEISEPGLKESYRALSPEFWRWLRDIETKRRPLRSGAEK